MSDLSAFDIDDNGDYVLAKKRPPEKLLWNKVTRRVGDELDKDKTLLRMQPIRFYEHLAGIKKAAQGGDIATVCQMTGNLWASVTQLSRDHVDEKELRKLV